MFVQLYTNTSSYFYHPTYELDTKNSVNLLYIQKLMSSSKLCVGKESKLNNLGCFGYLFI